MKCFPPRYSVAAAASVDPVILQRFLEVHNPKLELHVLLAEVFVREAERLVDRLAKIFLLLRPRENATTAILPGSPLTFLRCKTVSKCSIKNS
jgi:hypothetical protein